MYKKELTQEEQLKLCERIMEISVMASGTKKQRDNNEEIVSKLPAQRAAKRIAEAYCNAYWITTLNSDGLGEGNTSLRNTIDEVAEMVIQSIKENVLVGKTVYDKSGKRHTEWKCPLKIVNELPLYILESKFPLRLSTMREHYLKLIDEPKFDKLLTHLLKDLYHVEDFESAFKFFKLWMINVKMKRLYLRHSTDGEEYRNPKTPIWLSLWSEHHSIGKGFVVQSLRLTFEELFNANTKTIQFKDFTKQFKGFIQEGTYICHADEADRLEKGTSDQNSVKTGISEWRVNAEQKGVDNTSDHDNNQSYISTTNTRVNYMIVKDMEVDRRLAEIHIVGACEKFMRNEMGEDEMNELTRNMWISCPVEPKGLDLEVRDIILNVSRRVAEREFYERLWKLVKVMSWFDTDNDKGKSDEKYVLLSRAKRVHWTTEVYDAYKKAYPIIGGWSNFENYAKNIGFLYQTKGNHWVLDFSVVKEGLEKYRDKEEESENGQED